MSSRVYGGGGLQSHFLAIHGAPLREPNQKRAAPKAEFLAWHRKEVFRGEAAIKVGCAAAVFPATSAFERSRWPGGRYAWWSG